MHETLAFNRSRFGAHFGGANLHLGHSNYFLHIKAKAIFWSQLQQHLGKFHVIRESADACHNSDDALVK